MCDELNCCGQPRAHLAKPFEDTEVLGCKTSAVTPTVYESDGEGEGEHTSQTLAQFFLFHFLPPELRLKIWRRACHISRVITLDSLPIGLRSSSDNVVPAVLHTSSESRYAALPFYKVFSMPMNVTFSNARHIHCYINFSSDVIYLPTSPYVRRYALSRLAALEILVASTAPQNLQRLLVDVQFFDVAEEEDVLAGWKFNISAARFLRDNFTGLKEVLIVEDKLDSCRVPATTGEVTVQTGLNSLPLLPGQFLVSPPPAVATFSCPGPGLAADPRYKWTRLWNDSCGGMRIRKGIRYAYGIMSEVEEEQFQSEIVDFGPLSKPEPHAFYIPKASEGVPLVIPGVVVHRGE